jgi:hypothetical protein
MSSRHNFLRKKRIRYQLQTLMAKLYSFGHLDIKTVIKVVNDAERQVFICLFDRSVYFQKNYVGF